MKSVKFASFRFILGLVSLFISVGLVRSIIGHWTKQDIVQTREAALRGEEARKAELERKLIEATGAAFIEKQAREKLGLVRPGDTIVLLEPSKAAGTENTGEGAISNWERWWRLFF